MDRIQALLMLEKAGELPPDHQKALNTLRAAGEVPPLPGSEGPGLGERAFNAITALPGAALSGLVNAPGKMISYIGDTAHLAGVEPPPDQSRLSRLGQVGRGAINALGAGIPAEYGLVAAPTNEAEQAQQRLGELVGGGKLFSSIYGLGKNIMRPVLSRLTAGTIMGAAPGLATGDLPRAVEEGVGGGATVGIGEGVGRGIGAAASPIIDRFSPAGRALRAQNEALGGGKGVLNEINKQTVESRVPDLAPESYTTPVSVQEAGEIGRKAFYTSQKPLRELYTARLENEVLKTAPEDFHSSGAYVDVLSKLATEGPEAFRNPIQKKLGKIAGATEEQGFKGQQEAIKQAQDFERTNGLNKNYATAGVSKEWFNDAMKKVGALTEDDKVAVKNVFETANEGQPPTTPRGLIELYQSLGEVHGSDSVNNVVKLAKQAVLHEINDIGKTYPDFPRAFKMWNKDYGRDVGQYYNKGTPGRALFEQEYGRPKNPDSLAIPSLVKMAPEEAQNVMQGIRQGPSGPAATDAISSGTYQHLLEKHQTAYGTNWKAFVEDISKPQQRRTYEVLLGPRFEPVMKLKNALLENGLSNYSASNPSAVKVSENFHTIYGGAQAVGLATGLGGGGFSMIYHLGQAAYMKLKPEMAAKIINDRSGLKLLAAGLLEKPGTPKANRIVSKLGEVIDRVGPEPQKPGGAGQPVSDAEIVRPGLPLPGMGVSKSAAGSAEVFQDAFNQGQSPEGAAALRVRMNAEAQKAAKYGDLVNPITDVPFNRAEQSAQVFQEADLAHKAFLQSPQGKEALLKSLRAQEGRNRGKYADTDQTVQDLRTLFGGDNSFGPNIEEHTALTDILRDRTAPANLKDMARSVLQRYPKPVIPPIGPLIPEDAPMVKEAAPMAAPLGEVAPAAPIKPLKNPPKGGSPKNVAEDSPLTTMNRLTKGEKILVSEGEMREMKYTFGRKAHDWFSIKGTQPIDDFIQHFAETYGTDPSYNGFKQFLEDALTKKY